MSALAITPAHLEECEVCLELEALNFSEIIGYKPAYAPTVEYLRTYFHTETISPGRLEHLRTRIVALCNFAKPTK